MLDWIPDTTRQWPWKRILAGIALLAAFAITYLLLHRLSAVRHVTDTETLKGLLTHLGVAGPMLIVVLMALAIVMSPIPSAPIALAAGAAYGHFWGTLYVLIGAEFGALVAFGIARFIGGPALQDWLARQASTSFLRRFLHSQNALMAAIVISRLMPFLSFDVISYAAGATPIKLWRFAAATLLGILPASFLLAHFGDEFASGDLRRAALTVLTLGALTLLPFAWRVLPARTRNAIARTLRRDRS